MSCRKQKLKEEIKKEMKHWYNFDLTDEQIEDCIENLGFEDAHFDTYEREETADYLAQKIANMRWPCKGDEKHHLEQFYDKMYKNCKKMGYRWEED